MIKKYEKVILWRGFSVQNSETERQCLWRKGMERERFKNKKICMHACKKMHIGITMHAVHALTEDLSGDDYCKHKGDLWNET